MRKIIALLSALGILLTPALAFAQDTVDINVRPPAQGVNPAAGLGTVLSNALTIVFVIAALAVLFMLVWGAFSWITSGGGKEQVDAARKRIVAALIGLAILALAFLIVVVVGNIVGINVLDLRTLPTLGKICPADQVYDPAANKGAGACVKAPGR